MSNYSFKRIDRPLYKYIKGLYLRAFNLNCPLNSIEKKYNTSSFGLRDVGYMAFDEQGFPAGYYGVFPIVISYLGKDYIAAQSGDTMTDPNHQKKGLFIKLAKQTYSLAKENNVKLIFGFPNENSLPGFKNKLDWKFYGNMQEFKIRTNVIPICEIVSKIDFLKPLYHAFCRRKLSPFIIQATKENIAVFSHNESLGGVKKDISFFNYKQRGNSFLVKINSFVLFIKPEGHLFVGDVAPFDMDNTKEFFAILFKLSRKLGCGKIVFSVSKNYWLYDLLSERFESKNSLPIGFLELSNDIPSEKISFTIADFDTF